MADTSPSTRITLTGFILCCFAVVGLVGAFATFAAPLPLERALAREEALDAAQAALSGPNPQAAILALKDRLDDSAASLIPLPADPLAAIAAERVAMRARQRAEADAVASRMRLMIGVVTVMAAAFGTAITGFARRG